MGGGTRTTTQSSEPWDIQIPYLKKGFAGAEELLKAGAPAYYQGSTVAGFDPAQQAAQKATLGYAMGPRAAAQQYGAESALARSLSGYTGFSPTQTSDLLAGNVRTGAGTPYGAMENALTQGVMSNLKGNILPGLRQNLISSGQEGGGSRNELVQNKAIANAVQSGLTKPLAQMYSDAYTTAQGMRLPTAEMGIGQQQFGQQQYPTTMAAPLGMYGAMADVGDQRRALTQAGTDADVARYNYEAMSPYQALANYMGGISGDYGGQSTMTQPGPSALSSLGQIAGIASMFSDERLKENITQIGSFNGLGVYEFNYLWSPTKMIGFIAQEVEKVLPEAVKEILGYKAVDYGKVLGEV